MKRICFLLLTLLLVAPVKADDFSPEITRVWGTNRIDTAVGVSRVSYDNSNSVIIANGNSFPDALSGSALANALEAPILLTSKESLSSEIIKEITRLKPKNIFVLGSTASVSENVENQLRSLAKVTRLGGENRYETSALIAREVMDIYGKIGVGLASGENFPDALTSISFLDAKQIPLLLTGPKEVPQITKNFIMNNYINNITVFGGEKSISNESLLSLGSVNRISGDNRYKTAIEIAKKSYPNSKSLILVNGNSYADALASSALMAKHEAPIMLVGKDKIPKEVEEYILAKLPDSIFIVGGTSSVSMQVVTQLGEIVKDANTIKPDLFPNSFNEQYAKDLANLLNKERGSRGLRVLPYSENLAEAARRRAKELSVEFSPTKRPDGSDWATISPDAKGQVIVSLKGFPEDIFRSIQSVSTSFSNRDDFQGLGIGVWTDANGKSNWVVIFGTAR